MEVVRIPRIVQDTCRTHSMRGRDLGFVPTMGALHEGHLSLIKSSLRDNHVTVVSLFVNPTQFGPGEDFDKYPRDTEADVKRLREMEVDVVFAPDVKAMYPEGTEAAMTIEAGALGRRLCGAWRPGHFNGVSTVVMKLLNVVAPKSAYFGTKDYQQYLILRKMAREFNLSVEMVGCPTIREQDGLAMSSRNMYLDTVHRAAAAGIYKALAGAESVLRGGGTPEAARAVLTAALAAEPLFESVQYAGVYDPETLLDLGDYKGHALIAVALLCGGTRLIDNILI